ncbi:MAG TPA: SDR family oxidoreductase [Candidatus Acidoferrum sp.]|nr:SDR family oxidoreductase [Candidatus Acidoferrum sp.]
MDLHLKDKVILITGGSNGIGAAITRGCVGEGAIPVIVDKDAAAGKQLQEELRTQRKDCGFIATDLLRAENCSQAVDQTLKQFARLDCLVNNAGVNDRIGLETGSPEQYLASLERNLFHYYNMAHYALPALKKSRGSIVNIASKTALTGQGGTSGYASAKGAVLALTREWAVELLPYEIRVNAVVPAEVMTPLYKKWLATFPHPGEKLNHIVSKIPLGKRITSAEEIAATVLFLLSAQAGHTTGQFLFVDGGYVHLDRALS